MKVILLFLILRILDSLKLFTNSIRLNVQRDTLWFETLEKRHRIYARKRFERLSSLNLAGIFITPVVRSSASKKNTGIIIKAKANSITLSIFLKNFTTKRLNGE